MVTLIKATRREWEGYAEWLNGMGPDEEQYGHGVHKPYGEIDGPNGRKLVSNRQVRVNWITGSDGALVEDEGADHGQVSG